MKDVVVHRDLVLVEPVLETASSVIETEKTSKGRAAVVGVGEGLVSKLGVATPIDLAEGDEVWYEKGAGVKVSLDGRQLLVVPYDKIMGVAC